MLLLVCVFGIVRAGLDGRTQLMSSGVCGCLDHDLTQGGDYKTIMDSLSFVEFYIGGYSEDIQRQVVEIICNGVVNYGDHSQASGVGLRKTWYGIRGAVLW